LEELSGFYGLMELINKSGYTPQQLHQIEQRLINRLVKEYEAKGFRCLVNGQFFSGIDILVLDKKWGLRMAIESTNYSKTSRMHPNTFKRYLQKFSFFKGVNKLLVISFKCNISKTQWRIFVKYNIRVRVEGFQD